MGRWYVVRLRDASRRVSMMRLVQAATVVEALLTTMDRGARQWAEVEVLELRESGRFGAGAGWGARAEVEPWEGSGTTAPS